MNVRQKSLWRSKNCKTWRKRANQRAAKERIRIERTLRDEPLPDTSHVMFPKTKPIGFEITIRCLDDGESVKLRTHRYPWGLSISPTACARRVAAVLAHYEPTP